MQKVVQLLRVMRFIERMLTRLACMLFTFTCFISLTASGQDFQNEKVNLELKSVSLKEAFADIQKQSGIRFIYDQDIKKYDDLKITHSVKNITVKKAIELILKGTNLQYVLEGSHVMISEKPTSVNPNGSAGQEQGAGGLKGRVVEFETSQPLPGASVQILELNRGITTDSSGYYRFAGVRAGKYTLRVSFVSYTSENQPVEVKGNRDEVYDIKLQGNNRLGEVIVTATGKNRRPVAHALERQVLQEIKMSQSVVSGISSQQISKTADRNAAEVVQKIAGVTIRDDKFIVIRGMNERYNLTYLNGNIAPSTELYSRAFALDLIPTRIIDKILVYKSPAPDLMADMTGGAVKIFTKDAKMVKHFDIEIQTGLRENTTFNKNFLGYTGSGTDFLGFDGGARKLPSVVPGFGDFTKTSIAQTTYADAFSKTLNYNKTTALPQLQLTANYYNTIKLFHKNMSLLTSFSYKNEALHTDVERMQANLTYPDNKNFSTVVGKISRESQNTQTAQLSLLQNFTYYLSDSSKIYFKNFLLQQGQNITILRNTNTGQSFIDGSWQNQDIGNRALRDIILSYSQRFLYSGNVGGDRSLDTRGAMHLNWNGGYTYSKLDIPDQRAIHLQNNIRNDSRFPQGGNYEANWTPVFRKEDPIAEEGDPLYMGMISRVWIRNSEQVFNGSVDYSWKIKRVLTLKAGTYLQWKQRDVYRKAFTLNEGDLDNTGIPSPGHTYIGSNGTTMDYNLLFFHQQDLNKVWSNQYLRDDGSALKVIDRTSGSDAYVGTEQNNSGYIAASLLPFDDKLDIYGGVRVEYNRQKVAGAIAPPYQSAPTTAGGLNVPVLADLKSTQWFPSLNINYRPNNSLVLRAAYGKTINRPEFRELSPYSELDYLNNQYVKGNPYLTFATANNYDLRAEWYSRENKKGETVSIGGFYKKIENPIERVIFNDMNTKGQSTLISFLNAHSANVYGLELDIKKSLDFLPGSFFRDLSLIANGSFIYSKIDSVGAGLNADARNVSRQLQGQAPYNINAGLYYENAGKGLKVALIFNQVGPRIYAASVGKAASDTTTYYTSRGNQGSLIELTRSLLDFSLTKHIVKGLQVKLSIQNLLNNPIQVAEDANFTYKYEKPKFLRTTPSNSGQKSGDHVSGDLLASDFRPGRQFFITFTYSF